MYRYRHTTRTLVNLPMLMRVAGWLLMIEALFMLVPVATAVACDESDWIVFSATAAVTAIIGFILSRRVRPEHHSMGKRDGFLLTAIVWVIFSLFGMAPFMLCECRLGFSDAFFEAMSGFTTTGASVMPEGASVSHAIHIWRATMQWIGGMGIILFTLAVIPMLNSSGGMLMFNAEVTGITHDKLRPRISQTAKTLWGIYFGLTAALIALLWAGPMNFFDSVCHAFGTVSTGGYSNYATGIENFDSTYIKIVLIVFMFAGGMNFSLIYRGLRGEFAPLRNNDVFRTYVGIIAGAYVLFVCGILMHGHWESWRQLTVDPLFQVVSTLTSTGSTPMRFHQWGPLVVGLVCVIMFFGGCAGSTSGGAKIDRFLVLAKNCRNETYRCIYPHFIMSVRINGRVVGTDLVNKVVAFLCIYMILIVVGGLIISAMGVPAVDAFFSSLACMCNSGFGADTTGLGSDYLAMPDAAKWVLSFLMLTGRLEIFTILLLFAPSFWHK